MARNPSIDAKRRDHFLQANLSVLIRRTTDNFRYCLFSVLHLYCFKYVWFACILEALSVFPGSFVSVTLAGAVGG